MMELTTLLPQDGNLHHIPMHRKAKADIILGIESMTVAAAALPPPEESSTKALPVLFCSLMSRLIFLSSRFPTCGKVFQNPPADHKAHQWFRRERYVGNASIGTSGQ